MENEIIVVRQLPIIEEQLRLIKSEIELDIKNAIALECNRATYKSVKKSRAELNKKYQELEAKRIEVKRKILEPYNQFDQIYKECVSEIFKSADQKLSEKIKAVENSIKSETQKAICDYFFEYCTSCGIGFLKFEDCGISITLNSSKKNLIDQVKDAVDKVAADIKAISEQKSYNSAELLAEYKKSLSLSDAISVVAERKTAIAAEASELEKVKVKIESEKEVVEKVVTAICEPPIKKSDEKIFSFTIKVSGTIKELKSLKTYMKEANLIYEQQ